MYFLLLALIYIAFISLGLPDSLLGSAWPVMHEFFGVPIPFLGVISMVISGSTIFSSLASDWATRKFGTRAVTVVSVFVTGLAMLSFSFATEVWMLIALSVPYGLGAGAIDAGLNNYLARHYSSKYMSWMHCFWGVGAMTSPFIMSYALSASAWNDGYRIVSFIQLGIGFLLLLTLPVWKVNSDRTLSGEETKPVGLLGALKIKGVPSIIIGFFAYCAAESTAMGWASTYFTQARGIGSETAAAYASLVFIGMTVGRFVCGFFVDKLGDRKMIQLGTALAICGAICLMIPVKSDILAVIGFVTIGLGYAPAYPCIVHSTPGNFGQKYSGAIIGIQMAGAYMGATFMPPVYGLLGKWLGYGIMPVYLLAFLGLMIYMTERTFRVAESTRSV